MFGFVLGFALCIVIFLCIPAVLVFVFVQGIIEDYLKGKEDEARWEAEDFESNIYVPTLRDTVRTKPTTKPSMSSVASKGLASANKGNPFWNKSQAMKSINQMRVA